MGEAGSLVEQRHNTGLAQEVASESCMDAAVEALPVAMVDVAALLLYLCMVDALLLVLSLVCFWKHVSQYLSICQPSQISMFSLPISFRPNNQCNTCNPHKLHTQ